MYIFIPNKSEGDKNEYDKNNGKIVSLSLDIAETNKKKIQDSATIDVKRGNVRKNGFLLTNTRTVKPFYLHSSDTF